MFVVGHRSRTKEYGPAYPSSCPTCKEQVEWEPVQQREYYHIYWIKIWTTDLERGLRCPNCGAFAPVDNEAFNAAVKLAEQRDEIEAGGDSDRYYQQIERLETAIQS